MQMIDFGLNRLSGNLSALESMLWLQYVYLDSNIITGRIPATLFTTALVRCLPMLVHSKIGCLEQYCHSGCLQLLMPASAETDARWTTACCASVLLA